MSDTLAITELLRDLGAVLAACQARWYVFGAQAVLVWGRPRLTGDVDQSDLLPCFEEQVRMVAVRR